MEIPAMNVEKLLAYADRIEGLTHAPYSVDEEGFNMGNFVRGCGTPSCIAGWVVFWEEACSPEDLPTFNVEGVAREALGLTEDQSEDLFYGIGAGCLLAEITPQRAARAMRSLANTGEVDWG
jgi:hypothetical protein